MFGLGALYHLGKSAIAAIKGDKDEMLNEIHEAEQSLTHPFDGYGD